MKFIDKIAWLYTKNRKVLFVRSKGKNIFFTAGGKREEGETDEQTLIREIKEELGVNLVSPFKYLTTFRDKAHGLTDTEFQLTCYTSDFIGELKPSSEIEELIWLDTSNINNTTDTGKLAIDWLKEKGLVD